MNKKLSKITEIRVEEVHEHANKGHFYRIYFYYADGTIKIMDESSTKPILARYVSEVYQMKKLDNKIKGVNIELDKNTKLYELNGVIDKFKKATDKKFEVKISLSFDTSYTTLHLKRIRKPYLKLVKN